MFFVWIIPKGVQILAFALLAAVASVVIWDFAQARLSQKKILAPQETVKKRTLCRSI